MAPTLPPPVLDHVLSQDGLRSSDLARCCRVARSFLDPARRTLYHHLYVLLSEPSEGSAVAVLEPTSRYLEAVVANQHLADLVRKVSLVEVPIVPPEGAPLSTATMVLARVLSCCRTARWFDLQRVQSNADFAPVLLAARLPLTHLFINTQTSWSTLISALPELRHFGLGLSSQQDQMAQAPLAVRPRLRSFLLQHAAPEPPLAQLVACVDLFCTPGDSNLTRLHLPCDVFLLPNFDLVNFPSLTSLVIYMKLGRVDDEVFPAISTALSKVPQLETLAIAGHSPETTAYKTFRHFSLAASAPPSLRRLVLGDGFSQAEVVHLLGALAPLGLRNLEWVRRDGASLDIKVRGLTLVARQLGVSFKRVKQHESEIDIT
ncbi:hypothetical protein JCM6882_008492 [Rhodosporidiobolus microsporus]